MRFLFLFLFSFSAFAAPGVFGPNAQLSWTYPAADIPRIEGFKIFVNGAQTTTIPVGTLTAKLKAIKPVAGVNKVKLCAYSGSDVSAFSNEIEFSYSEVPLPTPGDVKIILTFSAS